MSALVVEGGAGSSDSRGGDAATIKVEDSSSGDRVVGRVLRRGATCSDIAAELAGGGIELRTEEIAAAVAAEAGAGAGFIRTTETSGIDWDGLALCIEAMGARRAVSNCSAKTAR